MKRWWVLRRREADPVGVAPEAAAERELRERLESAEAALEALAEGIVVFDPAGGLEYLNASARDLIGRRFDRASQLAPGTLRDACREVSVTGVAGGLEFETAGRIVQASIVPRSSADEPGFGLVLVLRDVTATKRSERIRRDFVANASHELKTPVSAIAALAEALREAAPGDPVAIERFVALLQDESRRLSRLVADLLDLSRLEGERPELTTVALNHVVAEETQRLETNAVSAGLRMVIEPLPPVIVLGSEGDLGLLVNNLVDNAIHYSLPGGEVRVTLETRDGRARLTVSDTGIGIASRDLDRIFERFYRADPARSRQTGGTGLGLSIVRHVADLHGGTIAVHSVLNAGSTFTFTMPAIPAGPEPARSPKKEAQAGR